MEVSATNIQAFLRITEALEPNEIAGYLRYELDPSGTAILTDVHGAFHWRPESVRRRGEYVIAEFTNEHAGFYILTRAQLQQAIASGGFLREPYEGRHGLPETAATDPYTSCGLRKVICISALDDFLLHHMSNLYVVRHGVSARGLQDRSSDADGYLQQFAPREHALRRGVQVSAPCLVQELLRESM